MTLVFGVGMNVDGVPRRAGPRDDETRVRVDRVDGRRLNATVRARLQTYALAAVRADRTHIDPDRVLCRRPASVADLDSRDLVELEVVGLDERAARATDLYANGAVLRGVRDDLSPQARVDPDRSLDLRDPDTADGDADQVPGDLHVVRAADQDPCGVIRDSVAADREVVRGPDENASRGVADRCEPIRTQADVVVRDRAGGARRALIYDAHAVRTVPGDDVASRSPDLGAAGPRDEYPIDAVWNRHGAGRVCANDVSIYPVAGRTGSAQSDAVPKVAGNDIEILDDVRARVP